MAAGVPVIATQGGGIPEIVRDGVDGLLYPMGDFGRHGIAAGFCLEKTIDGVDAVLASAGQGKRETQT